MTLKKALLAILFATPALGAESVAPAERIEEILNAASSKRWEARSKADLDYRAALATTFRFADQVDVFLLDFSIGKDAAYVPKDGDEVFPIAPYEKQTKILKTFKVPREEVSSWCAAVKRF